jgi:oligopeptide transport system substrate-binding protein
MLDPARAATADQLRQVMLVFEPLVRVDRRTHEPHPGLAARWEASGDQTRFTFTLRSARFHDGAPVTAADVKASLDRVAARATLSPAASLLSSVRGYAEAHDLGGTTQLSGVSAPDAGTVVVELIHPFADFPIVLAHPALGIGRPGAAGPQAPDPLGSGPFRVESRTSSETALRRFIAPGAVAPVEGIALVPVANVDDGLRALDDGTIDVTSLEGSPVDDARGVDVVRGSSLDVLSFGLNLRNLAFVDERFRRSVLHALNREQLTREAFGPIASVADGIIPMGIHGSRPDACGDACTPDTGAAVQLIGEVFPGANLPILAVDFPDIEGPRRVVQEAQLQLAEVGIATSLRPHAPSEYASFLATGGAELFVLPDTEVAPTAGAFLTPRFVSGSSANTVGVASPEVDRAIAAADAERNDQRRRERYAVAARAVLDQAAVLPVAQLEHRVAASAVVRDLQLDWFGAFDPLAVRVVGQGSREGGG